MRRLAHSIALTLLSAHALTGQTDAGLRALALPESLPIFCRVPALDSASTIPRQIVAREFRFGPPNGTNLFWSREINVAFDSAGHALFLTDEASFGVKGSEAVAARIDSTGNLAGSRIDITVDSAAQDRAIANGDVAAAQAAVRPPVTRPLTPEEYKQLSALGAWLWTRRCGK